MARQTLGVRWVAKAGGFQSRPDSAQFQDFTTEWARFHNGGCGDDCAHA
jgi:hypothetical protein